MTADPMTRKPYDPTVLDVPGCLADAAWLRAQGITNTPDRIETLAAAYVEVSEERDRLALRLDELAVAFKAMRDQVEGVAALSNKHLAERDQARAELATAKADGWDECAERTASAQRPYADQVIKVSNPYRVQP